MSKTMNVVVTIVVIVILLVLLFFGLRAWDNRNEEKKATETSTQTTVKDPCADELKAMTIKAESLRLELNKCLGIPEPMTVEERLDKAEKELAALKKRRTTYSPPATRSLKPENNAPADVAETKFESNQFSIAPGSYKKTTDVATDINGGSKVTYAGQIPAGSKFGITVTSDRFRLYYLMDTYVRENGLSIPAPRLNGVNGPEFSLDAATGYWYYLDTSTLLSPSMVNNWDYTSIWCASIGRIGTWDGYLPHESMKALMKKVRGREDGEVTMDELYKMNASNSDIWTDQNKTGSIMPKSFNPISGEKEKGTVMGPEDGLIYQGWDFRCRTTGEVTTEKIVGGSSSFGNTGPLK